MKRRSSNSNDNLLLLQLFFIFSLFSDFNRSQMSLANSQFALTIFFLIIFQVINLTHGWSSKALRHTPVDVYVRLIPIDTSANGKYPERLKKLKLYHTEVRVGNQEYSIGPKNSVISRRIDLTPQTLKLTIDTGLLVKFCRTRRLDSNLYSYIYASAGGNHDTITMMPLDDKDKYVEQMGCNEFAKIAVRYFCEDNQQPMLVQFEDLMPRPTFDQVMEEERVFYDHWKSRNAQLVQNRMRKRQQLLDRQKLEEIKNSNLGPNEVSPARRVTFSEDQLSETGDEVAAGADQDGAEVADNNKNLVGHMQALAKGGAANVQNFVGGVVGGIMRFGQPVSRPPPGSDPDPLNPFRDNPAVVEVAGQQTNEEENDEMDLREDATVPLKSYPIQFTKKRIAVVGEDPEDLTDVPLRKPGLKSAADDADPSSDPEDDFEFYD